MDANEAAAGYEIDEGFFRELVAVEAFTDDEILMARWLVSQIRYGAKMRQGLLVEAHLSRLLGADLATLGNTPWDLRLSDGRLAEVKSFTSTGRVDIGQLSKAADVWIFVDKGAANDLSEAAYFTLTPGEMIEAFGARRSVSARRFLAAAGPALDGNGLRLALT